MDRIDGDHIPIPRSAAPTVWLATSQGLVVIDTIAVEKAIKGERKGWTLTADEAHYAARIMFDHHVPYSVVAVRVGRSTETLRAWFPEEVVPSTPSRARGRGVKEIEHGTPRGYYAHHRRGETPCQPCKTANAIADRHYRLHGTRVGAPTVVVAA
ncbi:hypothetical protein CFC35_41960 [Streptomyces sp. FBKL.4005]|uniref:hypothetical protein n=1 Tax=Streptomyces sp. FBKL.4005 TaxID=2015515 RepID=UPI000B965FA6|nr:hypothetical protein [Streptomyces sp. FBKL.4005]OYP09984.1 hypothetical protein CFC35_41960 [Streptomyces sp. FBKL.4005]